jgi:hypothetical protein
VAVAPLAAVLGPCSRSVGSVWLLIQPNGAVVSHEACDQVPTGARTGRCSMRLAPLLQTLLIRALVNLVVIRVLLLLLHLLHRWLWLGRLLGRDMPRPAPRDHTSLCVQSRCSRPLGHSTASSHEMAYRTQQYCSQSGGILDSLCGVKGRQERGGRGAEASHEVQILFIYLLVCAVLLIIVLRLLRRPVLPLGLLVWALRAVLYTTDVALGIGILCRMLDLGHVH